MPSYFDLVMSRTAQYLPIPSQHRPPHPFELCHGHGTAITNPVTMEAHWAHCAATAWGRLCAPLVVYPGELERFDDGTTDPTNKSTDFRGVPLQPKWWVEVADTLFHHDGLTGPGSDRVRAVLRVVAAWGKANPEHAVALHTTLILLANGTTRSLAASREAITRAVWGVPADPGTAWADKYDDHTGNGAHMPVSYGGTVHVEADWEAFKHLAGIE